MPRSKPLAKKPQFAKFDPEVLIALRMGVSSIAIPRACPESAGSE